MARRGLVIGKFYPPHRGHKHLIDVASAQVDDLSVIVCRRPDEEPAGDLRAAWLKEIHPNVRVILVDDELDPDDSRVWAEHSLRWLGFRPDLVFTSEAYGEEFANQLGCKHVMVDELRITFPISGRRVRSNPIACWEYLELPVRGFYARRVCLVGAESTGKTTLAARLAEHYQTVWVPEYGREYSELKLAKDGHYAWHTEEFTHIAKTQIEREDQGARGANKVLICDTDAFATGIWHRRYLGKHSPEVETLAARHRFPDLYLLTDVDVPFTQDGTRDGESIRAWMHETFISELTKQKRPFRQIAGTAEEQFNKSVIFIDEVVGNSTPKENSCS